MTLATHSTQAPAARKRGGGPAHIHQVNAMTIGRQPLPEGGEIKSLCRAAAGIIHTLSASTEARAYPTDRVRGAQKMEPRSANHPSPAAQPVKGYKHCLLTNQPQVYRAKQVAGNASDRSSLKLLFHLFEMDASLTLDTLNSLIDAAKGIDEFQRPGRVRRLEYVDELQQLLPQLKDEGHASRFSARLIGQADKQIFQDVNPTLCGQIFPIASRGVDAHVQETELAGQVEDSRGFSPTRTSLGNKLLNTRSSAFLPQSTVLPLLLLPPQVPSEQDCTYRTNPLYPSRRTFTGPRPVHDPEDQDRQHRAHNEQLVDIGQLESDVEFAIHGWLLATSNPSSLPAVALLVHGGAV